MSSIFSDPGDAFAAALLPVTSRHFRHLHRVWLKWRKVLRHFAVRGDGRPLTSSQYARLHRELLRAAEQYEPRMADHLRPELQALRELVRPWMSQTALAAADRILLRRLVIRGRQLERHLFGRLMVLSAMQLVAWMLLAAVAGGAVLWLANTVFQPAADGGFLDVLRLELNSGIARVSFYDTPYRRFVGALILMLVVAWWMTSARDD